jgi:hypothetical protein
MAKRKSTKGQTKILNLPKVLTVLSAAFMPSSIGCGVYAGAS